MKDSRRRLACRGALWGIDGMFIQGEKPEQTDSGAAAEPSRAGLFLIFQAPRNEGCQHVSGSFKQPGCLCGRLLCNPTIDSQ